MVFYWHDAHLLRLLHALWSLSAFKVGEAATKGFNKNIDKRRSREEEIARPDNHQNRVKMWTYQALPGQVEGCESCRWKTSGESYWLGGWSSDAHRDRRIPQRESIKTAFLSNLWTVKLFAPFWSLFDVIVRRYVVTTAGYVHCWGGE